MSETNTKSNNLFEMLGRRAVLAAPIIGFVIIKLVLNSLQLKSLIADYIPDVWNFEAKITMILFIAMLISAFIVLCVLGTIIGRVATTSANPLAKQDPPIILFFNRVLLNTLEQMAIFLPIFSYWTVKYSSEDNKHEVIIFGVLWVFGRLLFLLGYGFTFISEHLSTMRTIGFEVNIITTIILVSRILGKDIL